MGTSRNPEIRNGLSFQWDISMSAGFSMNKTTWLPVNDNYKTLNLAAQNLALISRVKVFKALAKLKKQDVMI